MSDSQSENPQKTLLQYTGTGEWNGDRRENVRLPEAPPWRVFKDKLEDEKTQQLLKGRDYKPPQLAIEMVNAALTLRRPLLITGKPGTGKSTLAYSVTRELGLGLVLKWSITTRTNLKDGLYSYDALARLQDVQLNQKDDIGNYITLGPLGTAFVPGDLPRVLLIDEIDKSDIDLPNDLLNLFEDGQFKIRELERLDSKDPIPVRTEEGKKAFPEYGVIRCREFPLVIMTSNGERDFPPPFLRRCLRFKMPTPDKDFLEDIVRKHFHELGEEAIARSKELIADFANKIDPQKEGLNLATDQLLNVIHLRLQENTDPAEQVKELAQKITSKKTTTKPKPSEDTPRSKNVETYLLKDLDSPEEEG